MNEQIEKSNNDKKLIGTALVKIAIILIVSLLVMSIVLTRAWITSKTTVKANQFNFTLSPDLLELFYVSTKISIIDSSDNEIKKEPKSRFIPGSSEDFYVGLFNRKTDCSVTINTFGIEKPNIWLDNASCCVYDEFLDKASFTIGESSYDEVPIRVENASGNYDYKYFGQFVKLSIEEYTLYNAVYEDSKVKLQSQVGESQSITGSQHNLLSQNPSEVSESDFDSVFNRITLVTFNDDSSVAGAVSRPVINPNQAIIFKIHIEFENIDAEQNEFISFGSEDCKNGNCHRFIFATYESNKITGSGD